MTTPVYKIIENSEIVKADRIDISNILELSKQLNDYKKVCKFIKLIKIDIY